VADYVISSKQRSLLIDVVCTKMMCFNKKSDNFYYTDFFDIVSHFYNLYSSVGTYNEMLRRYMNDNEVINMITHSFVYENIIFR